MTGAMLLQAWADTLVTTGLLVAAVLMIRKPFARHFGPRLAYMLWLVPALRLFLPPLPFADPVPPVPAIEPTAMEAVHQSVLVEVVDVPPATAEPLWTLPDLLPFLFTAWVVGFVAVLVAAMAAHRRFLDQVLHGAVELEPIGSIRLVMSDAVDGPVAFGLLRRCVAVPLDFFGRYAASERALAIDHELAHHRHGDLWANAAALLLLAAQWFNPFAWRAIRAFRFDQEAACDARVLTMAGPQPRAERTAQYATAIAKAAMGSRLSLAAPMAVHDNLQERLTMLTKQDISRRRGLVGRLLVGTTALAVLATTATLVPAATASVQDPELVPPPPPEAPLPPEPADIAPPTPPAPPAPPEAGDGAAHVLFVRKVEGDGANGAKQKRVVSHSVIRHDGEHRDGAASKGRTETVEFNMPGSLSREEILTALKEQGVSGRKAEKIADTLAARGKRRFSFTIPPVPPVPPIPPQALAAVDGRAFAFANCGSGKKPAALVDRDERKDGTRSRVVVMSCSDLSKIKLKALKDARESFARSASTTGLDADVRAEAIADIDRAIAEVEKETP